jgi:hypothetical protein
MKTSQLLYPPPDSQAAIEQAIRDIGLALNITHGAVATDAPDAQPGEACWRVDHSKEIAQLEMLKNQLRFNTDTAP